MMKRLTIDEATVEAPDGATVLEAARIAGIRIPSLCHNDRLSHHGGCRVCLVEIASESAPDRTRLMPACCSAAESGYIVRTATRRVIASRRFVLQLMLSRSPDLEILQELLKEAEALSEPGGEDIIGSYLLGRAPKTEETRCIRCSQCVRTCAEIVERNAISFEGRGMGRRVTSPFKKIAPTCIGCGACAYVCPAKTITIEEAAVS
jgi:bidirectional [NiFe] hydrogenase diaphorase subunit